MTTEGIPLENVNPDPLQFCPDKQKMHGLMSAATLTPTIIAPELIRCEPGCTGPQDSEFKLGKFTIWKWQACPTPVSIKPRQQTE